MPHPQGRRVTQKDIAARAGLHRSTVSLVFKNHAGIPEKTRQHVLRIAKELGYEPDPMLTALASYRNRARPAAFHGTLGWLVNHQNADTGWNTPWNQRPIYREYYEGAKQRARLHGYHLETFDLNQGGITAKRMASILRSRNVQGLILCPQPVPHAEIDFPWDDFAAVTMGYTLKSPRLHIVAATQYRNAAKATRILKERGYHRIGYVVWQDFNQRTDNNYWAGYLSEAFSVGDGLPVPPLADYWGRTDSFREWQARHRPDAIVTSDPTILDYLSTIEGIDVPGNLGVACFALPNTEGPLAGIHENSPKLGMVAADYLVGMILRSERGIPETPQLVLVEGTWVEGKTVAPLPSRPHSIV